MSTLCIPDAAHIHTPHVLVTCGAVIRMPSPADSYLVCVFVCLMLCLILLLLLLCLPVS